MSWFVVDVEADGPCPGLGSMTAIGVVCFEPGDKARHKAWFREWVFPMTERKTDIQLNKLSNRAKAEAEGKSPVEVLYTLKQFVEKTSVGRPVFVSDNPAFDWQWVNYYFHHYLGGNPFGHSARRIGDLACGAQRDVFYQWKKLRDTPHTHDPLDDAMGNVEALEKIVSVFPPWVTPWKLDVNV